MIYATTIDAAHLSTAHRPRASVKRGKLRMHKAERYAAWIAYLRLHLRAPQGWPLDARYLLRVAVFPPTRRAMDGDNAVKPIMDAGTWALPDGAEGTPPRWALWHDDSQVRILDVTVADADPEHPRVCMIARVIDDREIRVWAGTLETAVKP